MPPAKVAKPAAKPAAKQAAKPAAKKSRQKRRVVSKIKQVSTEERVRRKETQGVRRARVTAANKKIIDLTRQKRLAEKEPERVVVRVSRVKVVPETPEQAAKRELHAAKVQLGRKLGRSGCMLALTQNPSLVRAAVGGTASV